ncbi:hypothetical protein F442_14668 [Phytophthora nicotianae P10297]|uniref:Chromo domain-containing protein n=1 Tax=Phytophthora nicotianae P10297 TaxID=1317064 RepID=W2YUA5_PHYNI|nr:hypothetical protein F442_14668 [Phytophthora nicotianae P10297]
MDLAVKFEDFDSLEQFTVLDLDPYDMILGMPWLEKHEPRIDWRGKAIGVSRPAVTDRALVSHVPTSVRTWGARKGRQGTEASSGCLGVVNVYDDSKVHMRFHTRPREPPMSGLRHPKTWTGVVHNDSEPRARALPTPWVEGCYHILDGETDLPVKASVVHLEPLLEVAELLNLEEMTAESFLADLKAGEIAEMVLIKQETSQAELNSSSVLDEDVLEELSKQRQSRLGSEILKNPKYPVYLLVSEYADVVTKNPPSQLSPDRGVRHEIDLVPGTKYCVTRQWPLPREQCEVIDAFFATKAKASMVRESKSPHSTPTFCVRKPNGKCRLFHAFNKLNSATVPAQTPIQRKDVLLNNMADCVLYSALDLVDGYYQIRMRESDIPLTTARTPSGMPLGVARHAEGPFVHSRAEEGKTATEVPPHVMQANKLYANIDNLLYFRVKPSDPSGVVVPNNEDLKFDILAEAHDAPSSGHLGREKTFLSILPVPADCWKSMSLDFIFGLPADGHGNTGTVVFVCRLSKMVHLAPVPVTVTGEQTARLFVDGVFRYHGLSETIVSDRDPRFTAAFWTTLFLLLDTRLQMSTADHPQTDGQTKRLPVVVFALNNAVHASTGLTPFYLNGFRHPRVSDVRPVSLRKQVESFMDTKLIVISRVRDAMAASHDRQKEHSDKHGRGNLNVFNVGELVLLDTRNLPLDTVSSVGSNKLKHRFIGPFTFLIRHGASYTIDLPKSMTTHPAFYVGRLKRYLDPQGVADSQTHLGPAPQSEERPQTSTQKRASKARAGQQGRDQDRTPEGPPRQGRLRTWVQTLNMSNLAERTRRPGGPPAHAGQKCLAATDPGVLEVERERPGSRPGRQHHHQSQGLVQSQAREHVAGDGQPQGPATDPHVEHSDESGSPEAPGTRIRTRAPPTLLDRNGEVHYHVERVLQERRLRGKRQLLVKWKGYAHSENSCEPIERLQADCPKAVTIWEQKRRQLPLEAVRFWISELSLADQVDKPNSKIALVQDFGQQPIFSEFL